MCFSEKDKSVERGTVPLSQFDGDLIEPSENLRTPLYHQIYLVLRQQISDGDLNNGDTLPGELDLAARFGVSRITIKRALDELARDGLVTRSRGRGTTVTNTTPRPPMRASFQGQMEDLLSMGLETEVDLIDFNYVPASEDVARALDCAAGIDVQRSVRIRRTGAGPLSHLTTYVPAEIGMLFDRNALAIKPLLAILEDCGVRVASADQTITATLADTVTARRLDMSVGGALIKVTRVVVDTDDRPVEYITALYRPDRYQYRMSLSRTRTKNARTWSPSETGYRLT